MDLDGHIDAGFGLGEMLCFAFAAYRETEPLEAPPRISFV